MKLGNHRCSLQMFEVCTINMQCNLSKNTAHAKEQKSVSAFPLQFGKEGRNIMQLCCYDSAVCELLLKKRWEKQYRESQGNEQGIKHSPQ